MIAGPVAGWLGVVFAAGIPSPACGHDTATLNPRMRAGLG
jgi:hypothetical protein